MITKEDAIKQLKLYGKELIERAENLVPDANSGDERINGFTSFSVTIDLVDAYNTEGAPEIEISYTTYNNNGLKYIIEEFKK